MTERHTLGTNTTNKVFADFLTRQLEVCADDCQGVTIPVLRYLNRSLMVIGIANNGKKNHLQHGDAEIEDKRPVECPGEKAGVAGAQGLAAKSWGDTLC